MDMNLSKLQEMVKDRGSSWLQFTGPQEWDVIERLNSSNVKKTTRLSLPILTPTPPKDWYLLPHRCAVNVSNTLSTSLPSRANDYLMVLHPCHCFSGPCTMWKLGIIPYFMQRKSFGKGKGLGKIWGVNPGLPILSLPIFSTSIHFSPFSWHINKVASKLVPEQNLLLHVSPLPSHFSLIFTPKGYLFKESFKFNFLY